MDTGELDFFNHAEVCTGKCMSRGSGMSKYDVPRVSEDALGLDLAPMGGFTSGLDNSLSDGEDFFHRGFPTGLFVGHAQIQWVIKLNFCSCFQNFEQHFEIWMGLAY